MAAGSAAAALEAPPPAFLGQQINGAVEADGEDFLDIGQVGIVAVMQDERAVAAEAGRDGQAGFGMEADIARQRQQLQRLFKRQRAGRPSLWGGRALGFSPSPSWT